METIEQILMRNDLPELLEIARKEIENTLVTFRDSRISYPARANGLVIRESSGKRSSMIRMGPEQAVSIGMHAIAKHLAQEANK